MLFQNTTSKRSPVRVGVSNTEYPSQPTYHPPYVAPYMYSPTVLGPGYVPSYYGTYGRPGYIPALPMSLSRPNGSLFWASAYEQPTRDESISGKIINGHSDSFWIIFSCCRCAIKFVETCRLTSVSALTRQDNASNDTRTYYFNSLYIETIDTKLLD